MARPRTVVTPAPMQKPLWRELYDHTAGPVIDWATDHKIASTLIAATAAGAITAGIMLSSGGSARQAENTQSQPSSAVVQTNSGQLTASDVYLSQVHASLLQDVPDLANYKSALDYTSQRVVDMKNVYGLSLDQVRSPVTKWVQANIDWDKKGERLIALSSNPNFITDQMFLDTFTTNAAVNLSAHQAITQGKLSTVLEVYIDELISEHDSVWQQLSDPVKLSDYMNIADKGAGLDSSTEMIAAKYKSAIRQYGTKQDQMQWGSIGLAWKLAPHPSGEEAIRNEIAGSLILAIGGDYRISNNDTYWTSKNTGKHILTGDRKLMIRMSPQLKNTVSSYGNLLDPDFLAPDLADRQSVDAVGKYTSWPNPDVSDASMPYVFIYKNLTGNLYENSHGAYARFLVGSPQLARSLGDSRF